KSGFKSGHSTKTALLSVTEALKTARAAAQSSALLHWETFLNKNRFPIPIPTQLFLSFPPEDTTVSARLSDCLADISTWMKNHHLQTHMHTTELMVFPAKQ